MRKLNELLSLAKRAAVAAGAQILARLEGYELTRKTDGSPLTSADLAANAAIFEILEPSAVPICSEERILDAKTSTQKSEILDDLKRRIGCEILGGKNFSYEKLDEILGANFADEISSDDENLSRKDALFWLVDPLDGTREFVKQNGEFCVCVALIWRYRPVLSAVFIPVSGELFYAVKGCDSGCEILNAESKTGENAQIFGAENEYFKASARCANLRQNIKFSPQNLAKSRAPSGKNLMFVSGETPASKRVAQALNLHETRIGSAIKFCLLARGESGIYYRTHASSIWDNAAGELIAAQAGFETIDLKSGAMRYDPARLECGKFVVIGPEFLPRKDEILALLGK